MDSKQPKLTILMFPWLAHGHIFPYLHLAKNLSTKNFNIFFISTPINLISINNSLQNTPFFAKIRLVELNLPSYPELPTNFHTTKNVPSNLKDKLFQAFQNSKPSFYDIIESLKPDILIYDVFQPWAAKHALSLDIPAVHFATSGATPFSFFHHYLTCPDSPFPYEAIYLHEHELKAMKSVVFPDSDKKNDDLAFGNFNLSCEIVLMRTCRGIEGKYIDYLSRLCKKNIIPVGANVTQVDDHEQNDHSIMEWLSEKTRFSTVFISFGSENYLSKDQMEEIAKGLEISNANFIWVVRFPLGEKVSIEDELPKGFFEKVKNRGKILEGWAPQGKILADKSIGGFVSHCGMSSIIESVYFGVPIIALPLKLDQPFNARLVVEAGVGVEVERGENGNFGGDDVAKAISRVVEEAEGEEMRMKCVELSEKMKNEEEDAIDETSMEIRRICVEYKKNKMVS